MKDCHDSCPRLMLPVTHFSHWEAAEQDLAMKCISKDDGCPGLWHPSHTRGGFDTAYAVAWDMQGTAMLGPIPSSISLLENMTHLKISDLSGSSTFPNLEGITKLKKLVPRNCSISGSIPPYIELMTKLKELDLSFNNLMGQIPSTLQILVGLKFMFLTNNSLMGAIPDWIIKSKKSFDFSYNNFNQSSPSSCQTSPINLVSSHLSSASNSVWCLKKGLPCSGNPKHHSLFINCGGGVTTFEGNEYVEMGYLCPKDLEDKELCGLDLQTGYFSLRQIKSATGNFDPDNKISEGGFGPVYKGALSDGVIIAVKQLSAKSKQ